MSPFQVPQSSNQTQEEEPLETYVEYERPDLTIFEVGTVAERVSRGIIESLAKREPAWKRTAGNKKKKRAR